MRTTTLVIGMILLVYGAQGAVRQLVDHDNAGLLGWLPGGFGVQLAGHVVLGIAGLLLAGWGRRPSH
ncbi:hypothetical protein [Micromonospora chokoriensis]|uniref:Uncharacterized protein n=1 Tax=Micromonospora chokoriensis TaxID=356851 RepID=A0A1C4XA53_9ACTN|nr:hypothetical protein [Micromonospora chokoriensis]SCF05369.1 hypothetical protein GA0070612_3362 [Micromonospora chokoriensis]